MQDMKEQNFETPNPQSTPSPITTTSETWKIFEDCQISLPLAALLKLVPRFTEKVATIITQKDTEQV